MNPESPAPVVTPLWPEGAPGALGAAPQDIPSLTTYRPASDACNGATMLILPGGGYHRLAPHEGKGFADWLVSHGITCHVLQYRLGTHGYRHPCMHQDVSRGLRMARLFARRDGLDPARVGIIGSSAGGHLASTLLTRFDHGSPQASDPIERESSRPDLGVLCYPVISGTTFSHQGSFQQLLGKNPPAELVRHLSNELHVTADTPPTFIWHTLEDASVPVENAFLFASALHNAGVPFDLHIYEKGRHGLGLRSHDENSPPWDVDCLHWLTKRGFLTRS